MSTTKTITRLKAQGRKNPRVEVYLDDELWETLDAETVLREGLGKGQGLDEARQAAVMLTDATVRARKAAAGHAAHSPKTRNQLERFLRQKRFPEAAMTRALEMLSESGTVDDDKAATRLVRTRRRKADMGPRRLEAELTSRGVEPALARRKVAAAVESVDLAAECLTLAMKVAGRYQPLSEAANRRRLGQYLLRRGYDGEHVRRALEQAGAGQDAEDMDMGED